MAIRAPMERRALPDHRVPQLREPTLLRLQVAKNARPDRRARPARPDLPDPVVPKAIQEAGPMTVNPALQVPLVRPAVPAPLEAMANLAKREHPAPMEKVAPRDRLVPKATLDHQDRLERTAKRVQTENQAHQARPAHPVLLEKEAKVEPKVHPVHLVQRAVPDRTPNTVLAPDEPSPRRKGRTPDIERSGFECVYKLHLSAASDFSETTHQVLPNFWIDGHTVGSVATAILGIMLVS